MVSAISYWNQRKKIKYLKKLADFKDLSILTCLRVHEERLCIYSTEVVNKESHFLFVCSSKTTTEELNLRLKRKYNNVNLFDRPWWRNEEAFPWYEYFAFEYYYIRLGINAKLFNYHFFLIWRWQRWKAMELGGCPSDKIWKMKRVTISAGQMVRFLKRGRYDKITREWSELSRLLCW